MDNMVPILYLDNTYRFGGATHSLKYLIQGLNQYRYLPVVVSGQALHELQQLFPNVQCYSYDIKLPWKDDQYYNIIARSRLRKILPVMKFINGIRFLFWLFFIIVPEAKYYYRVGKKHNVKLVHLNNSFSSQLAGILASRMLNVVCISHSRDFIEATTFKKFISKSIDHHIAISRSIKENLIRVGVAEKDITVVHDAIDVKKFNPNSICKRLFKEFDIEEGTKTYGMFGRIVEWKGVREFIKAVSHVSSYVPNSIAFIVGDEADGGKKYIEECKKLINQLKVGDKIIMTGFRRDIPEIMNMLDVVVLPTIRPEPFGMVLIEGMAMEKSIVTSNIGGPVDIVKDGETGFLVQPCDSRELSAAITMLLKNPTLSQRMGKNGRKRVETHFSMERYAFDVNKLYKKFLKTMAG